MLFFLRGSYAPGTTGESSQCTQDHLLRGLSSRPSSHLDNSTRTPLTPDSGNETTFAAGSRQGQGKTPAPSLHLLSSLCATTWDDGSIPVSRLVPKQMSDTYALIHHALRMPPGETLGDNTHGSSGTGDILPEYRGRAPPAHESALATARPVDAGGEAAPPTPARRAPARRQAVACILWELRESFHLLRSGSTPPMFLFYPSRFCCAVGEEA